MSWHHMPLQSVIESLKTDSRTGLTKEQARKVLEEKGHNKLNEKPPKSYFVRFLEQMKDVMVIILIIAVLISLGLNFYHMSQGQAGDWAEPVAIIVIILLNAILGVIQESRAEAALEALKKMSAPTARVIRDGVEDHIPSELLVPGDVVKLEAGDWVPADCRIISSSNLQCDEASLTGESVPVAKRPGASEIGEDASLGDRVNMLYSGCSVTYGTCVAVVTETGMKTEMGKIAGMLESEEEGKTPLQNKLAQLGKMLGILALVICAIIFAVGLIEKIDPLEMFMTAVSLAVAAIPEGLPAIVTIVLAIGVQRMVRKNAIIRKLPAVETLGSASVICSDKTGTLTQNRMTLVKAFDGEQIVSIESDVSDRTQGIIKLATLCTDGKVTIEADGREKHIGDPTETAIVACALRFGMNKDDLERDCPRIGELPFDSDRKMMSTIHTIEGRTVVIVKGAPDILFERCTAGNLAAAAQANAEMGRSALRVLAVAYKYIDSLPQEYSSATMESDLTFLGLVGMIDPPRAEAKAAIEECKRAEAAVERHPDKLFFLGFMRRYDPSYADAKAQIDAGHIGKPYLVKATGLDPEALVESCIKFSKTSGGIFIDAASHDIDLMRWFLGGEVTEVYAAGTTFKHPEFKAAGDDETAVAVYKFENGAMGMVHVGRTAPYGYHIETEIVGTEGTIRISAVPEKNRAMVYDVNGARTECVESFPERFAEAYLTEMEEFVRCVREGRKPDTGVADGIYATRVGYATTEAWKTGKIVKI